MPMLHTIFYSVRFEVKILIKYVVVILFIKIFISPVITPRSVSLAILVNFIVLLLITVMMLTNEDDYDPNAPVAGPGDVPQNPLPPPPPPTNPLGHNRSYLTRFITNLIVFMVCGYLWGFLGYNRAERKSKPSAAFQFQFAKFTYHLIVRNIISTMSAISMFRFLLNLYWFYYATPEP